MKKSFRKSDDSDRPKSKEKKEKEKEKKEEVKLDFSPEQINIIENLIDGKLMMQELERAKKKVTSPLDSQKKSVISNSYLMKNKAASPSSIKKKDKSPSGVKKSLSPTVDSH